jgi:hypothetical protein
METIDYGVDGMWWLIECMDIASIVTTQLLGIKSVQAFATCAWSRPFHCLVLFASWSRNNNVWYLLMKASGQLLWYLEATFHVLGTPEGGRVLLG